MIEDKIYELSGIETRDDVSYEDLKLTIHYYKSDKQELYNLWVEKKNDKLLKLCRDCRTVQKLAKKKIKQLYPARKK